MQILRNKRLIVLVGVLLLWWGFRTVLLHVMAVPATNALAFSGDGRTLMAAGGWRYAHDGDDLGGAVWMWDTKTGELKQRLTGRFGVLSTIELLPDGTTFSVAERGGRKLFFDMSTGRQIDGGRVAPSAEHGEAHPSKFKDEWLLRLSPDSSRAVSQRSDDECVLRSWPSGRRIRQFKGVRTRPELVKFSPDGQRLAILQLPKIGSSALLIYDGRNGSLLHKVKNDVTAPHALAFSPDGSLLAAGGYGGEVRIWDVASGALRQSLQAG
jgi:WD40 repeat protein